MIIPTPEGEEISQVYYPAHQLDRPPYSFHAGIPLQRLRGGNPGNDPIRCTVHPVLWIIRSKQVNLA
jgi:hypothetical protein